MSSPVTKKTSRARKLSAPIRESAFRARGDVFVCVLFSCAKKPRTGGEKIKRSKAEHGDEYYQFKCQHSTIVGAEKRLKIAHLNPTLIEAGEKENGDATKRQPRETTHRFRCPRHR